MAQSLRRPLSSALSTSSSLASFAIPLHRRCFSQSVARWAHASSQAQSIRPAQQPERSLRIASKELAQIPSDIGLLEETFITPSFPQWPSLFKNPRGLLKLQWFRLKSRFRDVFSNLALKWSSPRVKSWYKRTVKLNRGQIAPSAVALHRTMYTAFAEGDSHTLRKICADGLYDSFQARIVSRPRGEKTHWELVKYNKRAKLMSNRAASLPIDGAAIKQAVVRIASRQRLTRSRPDGSVIPGTGKEKDVVEYVVLQKQILKWKEQDWQVWGTTEATTLEKLERTQAAKEL